MLLKRSHIEAIFVISFVLMIVIVSLWAVPESADGILITTAIILVFWLIMARPYQNKFDEIQDERFIQLVRIGAGNSFVFMLFALPILAWLIQIGILIIDTALLLFVLMITSIVIVWISVGYHYWR